MQAEHKSIFNEFLQTFFHETSHRNLHFSRCFLLQCSGWWGVMGEAVAAGSANDRRENTVKNKEVLCRVMSWAEAALLKECWCNDWDLPAPQQHLPSPWSDPYHFVPFPQWRWHCWKDGGFGSTQTSCGPFFQQWHLSRSDAGERVVCTINGLSQHHNFTSILRTSHHITSQLSIWGGYWESPNITRAR